VSVWPEAESAAVICRLTVVPAVPVWAPGLVTVTVFAPPPLPTMGWLMSHPPPPPLASLAHMLCTAKLPVASDRSAAPPVVPGRIQAHLSPISSPLESVQPPAGFWSVMVSVYSWPSTMETPSRVPLRFTKSCPQLKPASVM
jgi:hypothetical protein